MAERSTSLAPPEEQDVKLASDNQISAIESANFRSQIQFEKIMGNIQVKREYQSVAALLFHWEMEDDDSAAAQDEVRRDYQFN
jgi:hypothetical protein